MKEVNNLPTKCILTEQGKSTGGGSSITLQSIEIATAPTKTSYLSGETFDATGMVVNATYVLGSVPIATSAVTGYSVSPTTLTDGVTSVTITYSEGGVTCTATQAVTVTAKVTKIAVTTAPTTTTYEYGDTFSSSGMVVTATYTDGSTKAVTGYSCSPTSLTTVGTQTITISYTENSVTVTTTTSVTVNRKSVTKPTWKSNLTYSGSAQTVTGTSYWNNYNTTYMTIGGTTSATNAGTYDATFTLGSNYRWADGTTSVLTVSWTIDKATGSLSLSSSSIAIDASNLTQTVTITRSGDGTISYSPTSISGLTLSLSGNTLTITGDGSTAVSSTTITISVAAGTNYTAPSSATLTVSATYWEWGSETATGDADWWAGLKTWAASATASERAACVGKTKYMALSTAVLGCSTVSMLCIGYDCDGTGTLAFQTQGVCPTSTVFGSSNGKWVGSTVRTQCQNFYSYCAAKDSIKSVSKGTCASTSSSRAGTATYNTETVWLPSEREVGLDSYSPLSTANSTTSNAECTSGYNTAYSYYSSNSARIKYAMGSTGSLTTTTRIWWERSLRYGNTSVACFVSTDGTASYSSYGNSFYLAPAFVIG